MKLTLRVNDVEVATDVTANVLLVDFLRKQLHLTGTHIGCETTQCGACTVHVEGRAIKSCTMLAVEAQGSHVMTIEGVALSTEKLHPMQEAFRTYHALQCGFCTPGMVMMGLDIARRHEDPSENTIRHDLKGNICRCTGYHNIVKAISAGVQDMRVDKLERDKSERNVHEAV